MGQLGPLLAISGGTEGCQMGARTWASPYTPTTLSCVMFSREKLGGWRRSWVCCPPDGDLTLTIYPAMP